VPGESVDIRVARVYRFAASINYPPVKAVAEALGCAPSTAAKWVLRARQAGLLPVTTSGKARA
jgi:hypothetical protein